MSDMLLDEAAATGGGDVEIMNVGGDGGTTRTDLPKVHIRSQQRTRKKAITSVTGLDDE